MTWKPLNLARKDGHPEPGQLCVIGRIWRGSAGPARREYMVGRFHLDPKDPGSRKLWWQRADWNTQENPATWGPRYHDIRWLPISGQMGGDWDA